MVRTAPPQQKPTTYAPTGTGLPEYWGTPAARPRGEPGPKPSRVLPRTSATMKEPGIWASKAPDGDGALVLLGTPIEEPEDDKAAERQHTRRCVADMQRVARVVVERDWDEPMTLEQARCVAWSLVLECLEDRRANIGQRGDAAALDGTRVAFRNAISKQEKACEHVPMEPHQKHLMSPYRKVWRAARTP